ncbi:MAG: pirin family protein [Deltaproteobacteria bacterium]|nr:pirin family protein [Deltaproteobacteria bacterium]
MLSEYRDIEVVLPAQPVSDGAGVRLKRSIGTEALDHLDPFLLLDEFKSESASDYIRGFPNHPHRGFETVTYMIAGSFEHRDHLGNHGILEPGSVQWMTAGRGIVHSEMPRQEDGLLWGFQLWVNLPASDKLCAPRYQDIAAAAIPVVNREDGTVVRVIAGRYGRVTGPVTKILTDPLYLDVTVPAGKAVELPVARGHSAFAYVFDGAGELGGSHKRQGMPVGSGLLTSFADGDRVQAVASPSGLRFLLVAAQPLGEPIARFGPFVMNTREEVIAAYEQYRAGTFLA